MATSASPGSRASRKMPSRIPSRLLEQLHNPSQGEGGANVLPYLRDAFHDQNIIDPEYVSKVVAGAQSIFSNEKNVIELRGPIALIGDMHGQFYDLLNLFEKVGHVEKGARYLFLGDYVDRGYFSIEVSTLYIGNYSKAAF